MQANCPQLREQTLCGPQREKEGSGFPRLQPDQSHRRSSTPGRAARVLQLLCGKLVI